jgi:hypothetical protein
MTANACAKIQVGFSSNYPTRGGTFSKAFHRNLDHLRIHYRNYIPSTVLLLLGYFNPKGAATSPRNHRSFHLPAVMSMVG